MAEEQNQVLTEKETGIADASKKIKWHRPPIDRKVLIELNKKNNWRPLIHNVGMLAFSAATGLFAFWAFNNLAWPGVVLATYFHCSLYGFFGGGAGGHELSHKNMFKSLWLNELFVRINGFLTWFNFLEFRHNHAKHHQYTVHHDLDLEVMLPLQDWWTARWWRKFCTLYVVNLNFVCFAFPQIFRRIFNSRREAILKTRLEKEYFPVSESKALRKVVNHTRFLFWTHLALALLFIATDNWFLIILVTFAKLGPAWFEHLTHYPQHAAMEPNIADWRHNTRTYLAGPIVRFFYWNMNYHVEHHMFAAVPFYNLPKLRRALGQDLPAAPRGLIATWREIKTTLRKQKEDPSYYKPLQYSANLKYWAD